VRGRVGHRRRGWYHLASSKGSAVYGGAAVRATWVIRPISGLLLYPVSQGYITLYRSIPFSKGLTCVMKERMIFFSYITLEIIVKAGDLIGLGSSTCTESCKDVGPIAEAAEACGYDCKSLVSYQGSKDITHS